MNRGWKYRYQIQANHMQTQWDSETSGKEWLHEDSSRIYIKPVSPNCHGKLKKICHRELALPLSPVSSSVHLPASAGRPSVSRPHKILGLFVAKEWRIFGNANYRPECHEECTFALSLLWLSMDMYILVIQISYHTYCTHMITIEDKWLYCVSHVSV